MKKILLLLLIFAPLIVYGQSSVYPNVTTGGGGISTVNTTSPILGDGSSGSHVRVDTTKHQTGLATFNDVLAKQNKLTLTTTGTSGASTLIGSTLNIPQYSGSGGGSYTAVGGADTIISGNIEIGGHLTKDIVLNQRAKTLNLASNLATGNNLTITNTFPTNVSSAKNILFVPSPTNGPYNTPFHMLQEVTAGQNQNASNNEVMKWGFNINRAYSTNADIHYAMESNYNPWNLGKIIENHLELNTANNGGVRLFSNTTSFTDPYGLNIGFINWYFTTDEFIVKNLAGQEFLKVGHNQGGMYNYFSNGLSINPGAMGSGMLHVSDYTESKGFLNTSGEYCRTKIFTSNDSIKANYTVYEANAVNNSITLVLPDPYVNVYDNSFSPRFTIKKTDNTQNIVTIRTNPASLTGRASLEGVIDGTYVLNVPGQSVTLQGDSTLNYRIISSYYPANYLYQTPLIDSVSNNLKSSIVTGTLQIKKSNYANAIPIMTSNTSPSGVASASSELSGGGFEAYKAFDNNLSSQWINNVNGASAWVAYQFTTPKHVKRYTVTQHVTYKGPQSWTFDAWNGSAWITLDTQTGLTWSVDVPKIFYISNTNAYIKYRINASNPGDYVYIVQITMDTITSTQKTLNSDLMGNVQLQTTVADSAFSTLGIQARGIKATNNITANDLSISKTITAVGTTGNQTINKASGRVNIATGGTTITVTNSLVTANSIIIATCATNDTTAIVKNIVASTGSFVITLSAATTAETAINFIITN
jgi:hypothetical protein